jgi:uncharacterized membrane protein (UPF0127 family)
MRTLLAVARRAVVLVVGLVCSLAACDQQAADGAGATTGVPPAAADPPPSTVAGVTPEGFERVRARVTAADGEVCDLCVWLADEPQQRRRGLMNVTDLGDAEAMAFVYPRPTTTSFWMRATPLPLSIAFFDADGMFLDSFDMDPCTTPVCPHHPTPRQFTVAVEVPRGGLDAFLMTPDSSLELLDVACAG